MVITWPCNGNRERPEIQKYRKYAAKRKPGQSRFPKNENRDNPDFQNENRDNPDFQNENRESPYFRKGCCTVGEGGGMRLAWLPQPAQQPACSQPWI
jgi:hypothetical protein